MSTLRWVRTGGLALALLAAALWEVRSPPRAGEAWFPRWVRTALEHPIRTLVALDLLVYAGLPVSRRGLSRPPGPQNAAK